MENSGKRVERSCEGIVDFLSEIYRISHENEATGWCTPGTNKGKAFEPQVAAAPRSAATPTPAVA